MLNGFTPMANIEKVSIALTSEMAAVVREAVENGEYASSSEVVREALREWKMRRSLQMKDVEEIRRLWAEGQAGGPRRFDGMNAGKGQARHRQPKKKS
jgi:antitoxin ParD1/3/4